MMGFWIVAALLVFLAVAAVVWPLLKTESASEEIGSEVSEESENIELFRSQLLDLENQINNGVMGEENGRKFKAELEQKLVEELEQVEKKAEHSRRKTPAMTWVLALLIPVMALPFYWMIGAQTELKVKDAIYTEGTSPEQLQSLLEEWVEKKPGNDKALFLLGSHFMDTGQIDEAVKVYRRLLRLSSGHPQVAAELAQSLFLQADNEITEEVRMLFERALRGDENNTTALGLKGIDAFGQGNYQEAVTIWRRALENEPNPGARQSLTIGINRAQEKLGQTGVQVKVTVELGAELSGLPKEARVIIFARPAGTRQPPIVAIPLSIGDLPYELVLDDSTSMMMGNTALSSFDAIDIVGRISLSGDVMNADYQVEAKDIQTNNGEPVRLIFTPAG